MDDLKSKFLELINKQGYGAKVPVVSSTSNFNTAIETKESSLDQEVENNIKNVEQTLADQEVLDGILPEYFLSESFDPIGFELKKLPDVLNRSAIEEDLARLETQQRVVSKQVLKLILDKTTVCEEEFDRILEVKKLLGETVDAVRRARNDLGSAHEHFTTASLGILANYRKRTLVQDLLHSLNTIKTLERTEARLQELLTESDFPGAISLLLECQGAATTYRHFTCVAALSGKLQDTLVMAEEQLDVALAKMCYEFEEPVYSKLQAAYALLGKTRIAMDQLHMHFTSAIHNSAFSVVHSYAQQDNSTKKQYNELCKCVSETDLIPCLASLCQALWRIVLSYYQISNWHHNNYSTTLTSTGDSDFESSFNEPYVKQKLKNGLDRLWHDVQTRVSSLVLAANLIHFKVDDFLQVLAVLYRLQQIGKEFTGKESEELQNSVRKQSIVYFRRYHAARLDELRIFLENEVWTVCPVQPDFTLLYLQEFKGLRYSVQQCAGIGSHSNTGSLDGSSVGGGYFSRFSFLNTPFDTTLNANESVSENIFNDLNDDPSGYFSEDSEEEGPELRGESTTDNTSTRYIRSSKRCISASSTCPLLTNTALTVLRHCGKYLQMSKLLRFIAADVIFCLCQLFEYYLFSVHSFFATDLPDYPIESQSSIKLQAVLKRIKENLLTQNSLEIDDADHNKVPAANIAPEVDLENVDTLYGLPVRVVAVESLIFLADQFNFLRAYLEQLLDSTKHTLSTFYAETISVAVKVRYPVYSCVAWRSVNTQQALTLMSRVNWEVNDVMSEHSPYVDTLFRELQIFTMRLNQIEDTFVHLEQHVLDNLWENIVHLLSFILVEGFSLSKRCSNGGRALMQLDFTQLFSQVEKLCSLRPLPYREFVDTYVKAYYLTEPALETFIKEHKEYSSRQLIALISCVCQANKKSKQRLCTLLEEWEKLGMR